MSKKMIPIFGTFFRTVFAVQLCHKSEGFFRELEGFFQRVVGSYAYKFPKHHAALLTDLPDLCLCLLELCLQRQRSTATEVVSANAQ